MLAAVSICWSSVARMFSNRQITPCIASESACIPALVSAQLFRRVPLCPRFRFPFSPHARLIPHATSFVLPSASLELEDPILSSLFFFSHSKKSLHLRF
jgi:hypothetical protein